MSKKSSRTSRVSSGLLRKNRCNSQRRKLESKVRRWKRYAKEIKDGKRTGKVSRWDISGLTKHLELLAEVIKRGATSKKR